MLETLVKLSDTQKRENSDIESISRKELQLAWLGGIIEGEGCISVRWGTQTNIKHYGDNRLRTTICIYNTNMLLMQRVSEILVDNGVKFCYVIDNRDNGCGLDLRIDGKGRAKKLLSLIMPYLVSKKRQAELTLELIDYRESLAIDSRGIKGRFGNLKLKDDMRINNIIDEIAKEKKNKHTAIDFKRVADEALKLSSQTIRLQQQSAVMI